MCGICGIIGLESTEASELIVRRMMSAIEHRGPDGEGLLLAHGAALGMRRLSIIDLPGGGQPIWNEAKTCAVVFNGEIYNFADLRRELELLGHRFRSHSDTEVIVHAYEAWGTDCTRHFRGMFAFAIVQLAAPSGEAARVFLARDRLGIKPLYYAVSDGKVFFASEVRALLASGQIARTISPTAIASYVSFGSVGEPQTLVEGVQSLPPGHSVMVSASDPAAVRPRPYWDLGTARAKSNEQVENSAPPKRLRALLEDSVQKHLIADVPVGLFLSSGIDSTALTALASQQRAGIHTFTLGFPEREFSETAIARRTAQRFKTDHTELLISGEELLERLPEAIDAFDQPSMDGINTYFVSWAARQAGLKVALSGLGSDEIFGGYSSFHSAPRLARISKLGKLIPLRLRRATAPILRLLVGGLKETDASRKLADTWLDPGSLSDAYFLSRALFSEPCTRMLLPAAEGLTQDGAWRNWLQQATHQAQGLDNAALISWLELRSYMLNTLLRDTDGMSMHHSLEVRVPFLDHPVVEYALTVDKAARHGRPKALLLAALGDLLPDEVVQQPKRTFTLPWEQWLRGPLFGRVRTAFAEWSPRLEPHLPAAVARGVWSDFLARKTSWSRPWALHVLNEWVKQNLETSSATAREARAQSIIPAVT